MATQPVDRVASVGSYELWMLAQGVMGLCGAGGMMFLIPAYVVAQGGSPADAGAVMALAGALALSGPVGSDRGSPPVACSVRRRRHDRSTGVSEPC